MVADGGTPTELRAGLPILSFGNGKAFETWLGMQGADASGLWLKLAKKTASQVTLSKAEAIDAALCQG